MSLLSHLCAGLAGGALVAATPLWSADWDAGGTAAVLRTQRLEVVRQDGTPIVVLGGMEPHFEGGLRLLDGQGRDRLHLFAGIGGAGLAVIGEEGEGSILLANTTVAQGSEYFAFVDGEGQEVMQIATHPTTGAVWIGPSVGGLRGTLKLDPPGLQALDQLLRSGKGPN